MIVDSFKKTAALLIVSGARLLSSVDIDMFVLFATNEDGGRTRCGDSPCAAQTPPPSTNPGHLPSPRHTDALAESWCAALRQAVACAQRQDMVVAHQPGGGGYCVNQFTPAREGKCRQLE